jgi:hypothetical protein
MLSRWSLFGVDGMVCMDVPADRVVERTKPDGKWRKMLQVEALQHAD